MADSVQEKENSHVSSPKSPYVLKPKPLCLRRKPKRLISAFPLGPVNTNVSSASITPVGFTSKSPTTCINPFKCSNNRVKRQSDEGENDLDSLQKSNKVPRINESEDKKVIPALIDENAHLGSIEKPFLSSQFGNSKVKFLQRQKNIPVDWSLKTKIRLTSPKPFPWRTSFRTSEEASGTTGFVRCLHSGDQKNCNLDSSHGAKFYQQCLVWMHPSIPWLNLFPRDSSKTVTSSPLPVLDARYLKVLHSNWCDSLRSLYQLVRTCQCPYFYLCASSFTVMFRSGGVGCVSDLHAAITPTSRGLRKALSDEGIEFTMPLHKELEQHSLLEYDEMSLECNDNSTVNGESSEFNKDESATGGYVSSEEEEPGMWLESLGLSQQDFPSLNHKRRIPRQKNVDHHPESLVYVRGPETQALVNFILNYSSCTSKVGPMAGIPPTLLSPVAFLGATLQSHKVRHAKIREKDQELYAVELSGPLLPNAIHSLCSLFTTTQDGNFTATLTPCSSTVAFTRLSHSPDFSSAFAVENLKDCGLSSPFLQHICSNCNVNDGKPITTITAENGLYSWS